MSTKTWDLRGHLKLDNLYVSVFDNLVLKLQDFLLLCVHTRILPRAPNTLFLYVDDPPPFLNQIVGPGKERWIS
jgi:hypothetical protein